MSDKRVVFDKDGVRVYDDGTCEGMLGGEWGRPHRHAEVLARALAESEAKRRETDAENVGLRRELKAVHNYSVGHGR